MTYYFDQHYKCGDKKFHNIYQAFDEQISSGQFPEYMVDQELVANIKNIRRPKNLSKQYIRDLMVKRLKDLRKKYNKLKLLYSGGTDSYTILRLCMDNDIYIDETITTMVSINNNLRTNLEFFTGLKHAKKYEGTLIGKCTEIHNTIEDHKYVDDPLWFKDELLCSGCNLPWRPSAMPIMAKQAMNEGDDTILLLGFEKPKIVIEDGKLFWTVTDAGTGEMMGIKNAVPFFLDKDNPELTVALTYATMEIIDVKSKGNNGSVSYQGVDDNTKKKLLDAYGFYITSNNFLNMAILGKEPYNQNRKNMRLFKELEKVGMTDYQDKHIQTHARIVELYGHLPHAIEKNGNLMKPIGRYSQKVPILQDKFGG